MRTKVWVVYIEYAGGAPVLGVYSTEAAAEEVATDWEQDEDHGIGTVVIEEFEIDAPPPDDD